MFGNRIAETKITYISDPPDNKKLLSSMVKIIYISFSVKRNPVTPYPQ